MGLVTGVAYNVTPYNVTILNDTRPVGVINCHGDARGRQGSSNEAGVLDAPSGRVLEKGIFERGDRAIKRKGANWR